MNINAYIKKFGSYTFQELEFNDVDALIFAEFSYLNLELLSLRDGSSIFLKDIPSYMLEPLANDQMDAKDNKIMLEAMINSNRYKDVYLKYIRKYDSDESVCQFFAVSIFFEDKIYISYRGTDLTLRAWKEDLSMCFMPLIPSQSYAQEYLKEVLLLEKDKGFYCGGHSKGGNLAIYAVIRNEKSINERLIKSYSFDGPGFVDNKIIEYIDCWPYKDKIAKLMPKNALVGVLLNTTIKPIIVDAKGRGALQHDPFNWKVNDDGNFKIVNHRARKSFINEYVIREWIASMNLEDKQLLINLLFDSFNNLNISVLKLKKEWWSTIRKVIKHYRLLPKKDKKRFKKIAIKLLSLNRDANLGIVENKN